MTTSLLAAALDAAAWTAAAPEDPLLHEGAEAHLLVSEVMAGGAGAFDEFVELYNPGAEPLPLEGLELVYVSASGASVSRKAEWDAGAASVPPGAHLLIANAAGAFAPIADVTYSNGLAATGGSVALRIQGAGTAIDAVGWGTAASTWLEGTPAPAVAAGHSIERLPGGAAGSGQDTDDNLVDFLDQDVPDPQNASSPPIAVSPAPSPSASPDDSAMGTPTREPTPTAVPTPSLGPTVTPTPASTPTASPAPTLVTIAAARAQPDGTAATVEGISLTDGTFADGGGYLADATGAIAVLVSGGTFPRGHAVRVTGELDDRYHQRTLRAEPSGVVVIGPAAEPAAAAASTGGIGEALEGQLVSVLGEIVSSATQLSGGAAYDLDDGTGPVRVVVLEATDIAHGTWQRGTRLDLRGVVGQRDSSGTGMSGYRLYPRDPDDVSALEPSLTPAPSASGSAAGSASPAPSHDVSVVSVAAARQALLNTWIRVRGVVTLPTSLLGDGTAAIQDESGAIVLRVGDEAGELQLGELVLVDGKRSTKSGMATLQVSTPPLRLGTQPQPEAARHATGALGEAQEARLVVVRGSVATTPRRSSAENVYFDLDDGSGPVRVFISPRSGIDAADLVAGSWLEITGVLGQETSGQQPERGHRLWPRQPADVRVIADVTGGSVDSSPPDVESTSTGGTAGPPAGGSASTTPNRAAPVEMAVPALRTGAGWQPRSGVAASPPPRNDGPLPPAGQPSEGLPLVVLLALAAALAAGGSVAAVRPGLPGRLRASLAAWAGHRGAGSEGASSATEAASGDASPLERSVARLVPLAVIDDGGGAEREPSTSSRSGVRRILPPT
ncbi:MAG TPA: lamin tail domain-containing protein [Candidatus Limnocylindria bacterium]